MYALFSFLFTIAIFEISTNFWNFAIDTECGLICYILFYLPRLLRCIFTCLNLIHWFDFFLSSFLQVDDFDTFKMKMLTDKKQQPYKRALMFVDNSGADIVLGMLPLARELLRRGTEVAAQFSFFFPGIFMISTNKK